MYAYLKPTSSSVTGPTLAVEVIRTRVIGGLSSETVVSEQAVDSTKINLLPIFKGAVNSLRLYAIIKYYFLLAIENLPAEFKQHFTPINWTFINLLKTVCEKRRRQTTLVLTLRRRRALQHYIYQCVIRQECTRRVLDCREKVFQQRRVRRNSDST